MAEILSAIAFLALNLFPISLALGLVLIFEEHRPGEPVDLKARLGEIPEVDRPLIPRSSGRTEIRWRIWRALNPSEAEVEPAKPETWLDRQRSAHWARR